MSLSEKDLESIKFLLLEPIKGEIQLMNKSIDNLSLKIDGLMKIEKDLIVLRKDCEICRTDINQKISVVFKKYDELKADKEKKVIKLEEKQETLDKKIEDSKYAAFKQAFKIILNTAAVIGALTVIGGFIYGAIKLLIVLGIIK